MPKVKACKIVVKLNGGAFKKWVDRATAPFSSGLGFIAPDEKIVVTGHSQRDGGAANDSQWRKAA